MNFLYRPVLIAFAFLCSVSLSAEQRTGVFRGQTIRYELVDGMAVVEGDIVLGRADELEAAPPTKSLSKSATIITGDRYRWPGGNIAYTIEPAGWSIQPRILQAIQHWNDNTPIKIVPRTTETNYVRFFRNADQTAGVCSSRVGMFGGRQDITLVDGCSVGSIIHEMGHAVGLWHEQSRRDRNAFATVLYENIETKYSYNFDQQISSGQDVGPYDFSSIMHYRATEFSKSGLPSLETVPAGIPVGQREGLSAGDIDAVRRIYGVAPQGITISTNPAGLQIIVDGATLRAPQTFPWVEGSIHTVSVPVAQGGAPTRYMFAAWTDGGESTHTVTAMASLTILTANFRRQHQVTAFTATGGGVRLIPASEDGFYDERSTVELTAVPDSGFNFVTWTTAQGVSTSAANPRVVSVSGALSFTPRFSREPVTTVATMPTGRPIIIDGGVFSTTQGFLWRAGSTHTLEALTTSTDADVRYAFRSWSNAGGQINTVLASDFSTSLTAELTPFFRVSAVSTSALAGDVSISPSSPDGFYENGTTIQLTATPAPGYSLAGWTGDLSGSAQTRNVVVTQALDISAVFVGSSLLSPLAVLNAASYESTAIAPGEVVTLFGAGIGPTSLTGMQVTAGIAGTALADTRVLFDGVPAPLIYVSENQVSAVAPYSIAGRATTRITAERNGASVFNVLSLVASSVPAIFTIDASGRGPGAILNQNYTVNDQANPAQRGSVVMIYSTGGGLTTPSSIDGKLTTAPLPLLQLPVSVRIGGQPAKVLYSGAAPGIISGALQINVLIPEGIPPGRALPVSLVIGTEISQSGVTVAVK